MNLKTRTELEAMYADLAKTQSADYVKGVQIADLLVLAAASNDWSNALVAESELDSDNDDMMDGYNDRLSGMMTAYGLTVEEMEHVIAVIDANLNKRGLQ